MKTSLASFLLLGALASSSLAGCSPSSTGTSSSGSTGTSNASGTVGGSSFQALNATARYGTIRTSDTNGVITHVRGLTVRLSNHALSCTELHPAGATFVELAIPAQAGGSVTPGSFVVVNPTQHSADVGQAEGNFDALDGSCHDLVAQASLSGSAEITHETIAVSGPGTSSVEGTLDVTFPGGRVTGSFNATLCPDAADPTAADAGSAVPAVACTP